MFYGICRTVEPFSPKNVCPDVRLIFPLLQMTSGICCTRMVFPHVPSIGTKDYCRRVFFFIFPFHFTLAMCVRKLLANVNFFKQSLHWCCLSLEWVVWWIFKPVGVANFFEQILQMHSSPAVNITCWVILMYSCYHLAPTSRTNFTHFWLYGRSRVFSYASSGSIFV